MYRLFLTCWGVLGACFLGVCVCASSNSEGQQRPHRIIDSSSTSVSLQKSYKSPENVGVLKCGSCL